MRLRALGRELDGRLELLDRRVDCAVAKRVGGPPHPVTVGLVRHQRIA